MGTVLNGNTSDYEGLDGARVTLCATEIGAARGGRSVATDSVPDWLRAEHGLQAAGAPARVVARGDFAANVGGPTHAWRGLGSVRGLVVKERDLVATLRAGDAELSRAVDWRLGDDGSRHVLLLEASGGTRVSAGVSVTGPGASATAALVLDPDPSVVRVTLIELPPGRYDTLKLNVTARAAAELRLQGWRVLSRP